ncbi:hypothetical protein AaE_015360 [Aphanomyces astaci]|uniref:Ankyrin repeat-containing domain n=1 Tax=Aphanomyces astaci TaxID=112090 RepID=A0A6A4Z1K4_APHAT|nr:hypothetical protein AaE_015360 [Aphanomyces astaci]
MDGAAANGHLAMVQYLHLHTTAGCTSSTVDKAIEHNHVHVAQWLVDRQLVQNYNSRHSMFAAAANGNLKALEWLMSIRMAYMASRRGYVDVVAYLQQLQPEVQVDLISLDFAAATGHLSMVKWLLTHRPAAGCVVRCDYRRPRHHSSHSSHGSWRCIVCSLSRASQ